MEYNKAKAEYTEYLKARGYSIEAIEKAFSKVETKQRKEYYNKEPVESEQETNRVFPLVTDFNPGLPNIGRILNSHKHILELDPELCTVIDPGGIFTSFRGTKTIHNKLIHSRLPLIEENPTLPEDINAEATVTGGCYPCDKKCDFCKNFLKQSKQAYSYHTPYVFTINQNLDCDSKNVVYIINDLVCKRSSVGCTSDSMKVCFRNHKSHIKTQRRTCKVSTHFFDSESVHNLDKSSTKSYTESLSKQLEVIIIEQVDVSKVASDPQSRLTECKKREWFWQNQLKTLRQYGGMNVREERYCGK